MSYEFILGLTTPIIIIISYVKIKLNKRYELKKLKTQTYYENQANFKILSFKSYTPMFIFQAVIFISGAIYMILSGINLPIFVKNIWDSLST